MQGFSAHQNTATRGGRDSVAGAVGQRKRVDKLEKVNECGREQLFPERGHSERCHHRYQVKIFRPLLTEEHRNSPGLELDIRVEQ